jgi:hypothetical protein
MILTEGPYLLYAEMETVDEAAMLMNFKIHMGWEVLSLPFPNNYELVDTGEETTEAHPRTWCVIMHRRFAR